MSYSCYVKIIKLPYPTGSVKELKVLHLLWTQLHWLFPFLFTWPLVEYSQGMLPSSGLPYQSNMTDVVDIIFEQWKPWKQRVVQHEQNSCRELYSLLGVLRQKLFIWGKDKVWEAKMTDRQTDKKKETNQKRTMKNTANFMSP